MCFDFQDVEKLATNLANCVYKYKVPFQLFNHFDFTLAKDIVSLVYEDVFYVLDKYNQQTCCSLLPVK